MRSVIITDLLFCENLNNKIKKCNKIIKNLALELKIIKLNAVSNNVSKI